MSKVKSAADVMTKDVLTLGESDSVRAAWQLFRERNISGAPVVDAKNLLVGVVSQHDLLRALTKTHTAAFDQQTFYYALPAFGEGFIPEGDGLSPTLDMPVAEFMNPDVLTVSAQDSICEVAKLMRRNHVHRVVVADGKQIRGIISVFDLLGTIESA